MFTTALWCIAFGCSVFETEQSFLRVAGAGHGRLIVLTLTGSSGADDRYRHQGWLVADQGGSEWCNLYEGSSVPLSQSTRTNSSMP